jgi:hypothetical protein
MEVPIAKKRRRKPKGGKIITKPAEPEKPVHRLTNIILHLKCSLSDLQEYNTKLNTYISNPLNYNPSVPPNILSYNECDNSALLQYSKIQEEEENQYAYTAEPSVVCTKCNITEVVEPTETIDRREINQKIKKLKLTLYKNQMDKTSCCFWCSYEYNTPPCYIPRHELDGVIYGYGSFCSPECATAFLMKENIDDSMKFERYHLLNLLYCEIFGYNMNIKPAPNPFYLLDKYYGNLTIQEYRALLATSKCLLILDKPMTRILPELHEENEDMFNSLYGIGGGGHKGNSGTGIYKVKKQSEKPVGPSKSSILLETFNQSLGK